MTTRLVYIDRSLCDLAESDRLAWQQWLARMGVDPMKVPLDVELELDDTACTIAWSGCEVNPDTGYPRRSAIRDGLVMLTRYEVQLEAPALPVPPGFRVEVIA